jgi:hypothetical protein
MSKHVFALIIVSTFFLMASCSNANESLGNKKFYDVSLFIQKQQEMLTKEKPQIEKKVRINGTTEVVKSNDIRWEKELELFLQSDLNKQSYSQSYALIDSTKNSLHYELKPQEHAPVKTLKIQFDDTQTPKSIEAHFVTNNFLYDSERKIKIEFEAGKMTNYSVNGWQKLFIGSKKTFQIEAKRQ